MEDVIYVCSYCNQQTVNGKRSYCCGDAIYTVNRYYIDGYDDCKEGIHGQ